MAMNQNGTGYKELHASFGSYANSITRSQPFIMRTPNLILSGLLGSGSAFLVPSIVNRHWKPEIQQHGIVLYAEDRRFENNYCRRSFLSLVPFLIVLFNGDDANAKDELFRPNPLTNPILEQVRIWEQAEADNLKYGGELEMGDAGNKSKVSEYPSLLVPILKIEQDLAEVKSLVNEGTPAAWKKGLHILQTERYDKTNFKKTFNKYGDNIYYSDPDRANAYLAGGATPKTEQSIAYLLRNDILTNMENLRAELEYLLKSGDSETEDLYLYSNAVNSAMAKYLAIVPPNELDEARRLLSSS